MLRLMGEFMKADRKEGKIPVKIRRKDGVVQTYWVRADKLQEFKERQREMGNEVVEEEERGVEVGEELRYEGLYSFFDDVFEKIVAKFKDYLRDVDEDELNKLEEEFEDLKEGYIKSFERIASKIEELTGEKVNKLEVIEKIFGRKFMIGWEVMRVWGSDELLMYAYHIEELIDEIRGLNREKREDEGWRLQDKFEEFEYEVDEEELKEGLLEYKKFVVKYLKNVFEKRKIKRIYRGCSKKELDKVIFSLLDRKIEDFVISQEEDGTYKIKFGKIKLDGCVVDSFSIDENIVREFGKLIIWKDITDDLYNLIWGCWFNASEEFDDREAEIIVEIPEGGLIVDGGEIDVGDLIMERYEDYGYELVDKVFNLMYENVDNKKNLLRYMSLFLEDIPEEENKINLFRKILGWDENGDIIEEIIEERIKEFPYIYSGEISEEETDKMINKLVKYQDKIRKELKKWLVEKEYENLEEIIWDVWKYLEEVS